MLESFTIEDAGGAAVPFISHGRELVTVQGLVGVTSPRVQARPRPFRDGSINRTRNRHDRIITVNGELWGDALRELHDIDTVLADATDTDRLCVYRVGGLELQTYVRLEAYEPPSLDGSGDMLEYQASLRASDPLAYSTAVYTARSGPMGDTGGGMTFPLTFPFTFTPGSAGIVAFDNQGSADTPPTFRLYGRLVNPRISLGGGGPEFSLNTTVPRGNFVEVNMASRRVLLDGTIHRPGWRDFTASRWFRLPRKSAGIVRLFADDADPDAYMTVTYRHAYG